MIVIKRTFIFLSMLNMLFVITCCAGKVTDKNPDFSKYKSAKGYEAKINVCSNDFKYSFKLTRIKPDSMTIELIEPEVLKNFKIIYENGISLFRYGDFTINLDNFPLPVNKGLGNICKILKNIDTAFEDLKLVVKNSHTVTYKSKNEVGSSSFEIDIDIEKIVPVEIRINFNEDDYLVEIKDFKFIQ